jgi:hypothetical protein
VLSSAQRQRIVPAGGSTDVVARRHAAPARSAGHHRNVGGAGGSIAVGRVARAAPAGYTIDIGQWDTHVGSVIYPITYDLQKDFEPIEKSPLPPPIRYSPFARVVTELAEDRAAPATLFATHYALQSA